MNPDLSTLTYSPHLNRSPRGYINAHHPVNHYQRQLDLALQSRQSSSPHHHARLAMANNRSSSNTNLVPQNNATVTPQDDTLSKQSSSQFLSVSHPVLNTNSSTKSSEWTVLDIGGMQIKTVSPSLFKYSFLTVLYLNHNNLQVLPPEIRMLKNLSTLDVSGNKLKSLPPDLGLVTSLKELLAFDNDIQMLPYELGFLFQLEVLGLQGNPIQDMILGMLQKDGTAAVIQFLRDTCPEGAQPPEREWIVLDDESSATSHDAFTLLCYNILSEKYALPSSYAYVPSWVLDWAYRKELITQELLNYSADIICLQEVETGMFVEYFQPLLSEDYDASFGAKTRSRTMDENSRRSVDGCATFYKRSKFILKDSHTVEFQIVAARKDDLRKTEDVYNRVMIKDNIAVLTLLEHVETRQHVLIGNVHLHWDPQYRDVKVVQTAMLMEEVENFLNKHFGGLDGSRKGNSSVPCSVILCGDYNSMADSGVVEFLLNGNLPPNHPDFNGRTYGNYTTKGLSHSLSMKSAYPSSTLPLSNYTPFFSGVIDHIFYSGGLMHCIGILGGLDDYYLNRTVGFPNWHHPSDHIPLLSSFKFLDTSIGGGENMSHGGSMAGGMK